MLVPVRKICQISGFLLFISIVFLALSVVSYSSGDPSWNYRISDPKGSVQNLGGIVGASVADFALQALGSTVFLLIVMGVWFSWHIMRVHLAAAAACAWRGGMLLTAVSTGLHLLQTTDTAFGSRLPWGGLIGKELAEFLVRYVNPFGAYLLVSAASILALFIGVDYRPLLHRVRRVYRGACHYGRTLGGRIAWCVRAVAEAVYKTGMVVKQGMLASARVMRRWSPSPARRVSVPSESVSPTLPEVVAASPPPPICQGNSGGKRYEPAAEEPPLEMASTPEDTEKPDTAISRGSSRQPRARKQRVSMAFPSLALLEASSSSLRHQSADEQEAQARFLEQKLRDFGVEGEVVQVLPGPVITMYEFAPAPGVKVSKIVNLQDDLALVMRALSVRVVAPVPGKAVVGIEIPNRQRATVRLRDLLDSEEFRTSTSTLTVALGKDILGKPAVTDLALIPHLLIAGATGSGKSVGLNSMICSLLFRTTPATLRMIMIDPKMLELSIYDGIPHLLIPVVTHPKQAAVALRRVVEEMERRYQLLATKGVRSIAQYNQVIADERAQRPSEPWQDDTVRGELMTEEPLPYLIVVIDELSDLMMVSSREVEDCLTRIAQMARAAGIHLMVATQRPSVDVLTGVIKANFPARMSFQVSSKTDSRTILDTNGAEKLLGRGDMLFLAPGTSKPQRIHGAYVSETEINRLVAAWRELEHPRYDDSFLESAGETAEVEDDAYDEKYDEAVALVARMGQASISMLQRRLRVGYNRAARMIETMEREGIIGPADGVRPREVLVRKEYDDG